MQNEKMDAVDKLGVHQPISDSMLQDMVSPREDNMLLATWLSDANVQENEPEVSQSVHRDLSRQLLYLFVGKSTVLHE